MKIQGGRHYLWRTVDREGDAIDILAQRYRNAHEAKRFFRKLLKRQERPPRRFKSPGQAQRLLSVHWVIQNCFRLGRHLLRPEH